ncbi:hypothetical protein L0F81_27265 [Streptomyces tricolor]|uniref:LigA protein n=1 Tax=Streptomyces tricolor TaxID=68277 RepID=A0ABS9JMX2_9ACTN|nr:MULTISPECIES: hypothetical protein [Streptomyces]MCG0066920.1 hypothetical protein [Streptomyces tricolor]BCM70279.1 hypothetical protein EASAB2608_05613 [Streptomyces sp. EAS-AB2608]
MAGQEFGHHLGLPRALSGLPLSPLVPGYGALATAQHAAGLRHLGEVLAAGPGGLRVLDGLYVPAGARGRRRVDVPLLEALAGSADPAVAPLAERLAELHRADPQAPRRVVLYQLINLLQDRPEGRRDALARTLGVHPSETAGLLAAARLRPRLDRRQREAAESLADARAQGRLHRLRALLDRLPAGTADPALAAVRAEAAERLRAAEDALRAGRRAEERGDREAASAGYLWALHAACDDRRALGGLVRVHGRTPTLGTALRADHVEVRWQDNREPPGEWRLLRLYRDGRGRAAVRTVLGSAAATAGPARDTGAEPGTTVRYAALPLRDGRLDGPPLVSRRLLVAPDVSGLVLTDGPERIDCSWHRPPAAAEVTVEHTAPDGRTARLPVTDEGFTATGLAAGGHAFRVVCHYRAPDGRTVPSPGLRATATVHPWPRPVRTLTARPVAGAVRFAWTGAEDAEVRLVTWPDGAPAPGTELRTDALPPPLDWPGPADALCPPPGSYTEVAAVAVRGARALAGPAVGVEAVRPVPGMTAHRLPDGQARIVLDWPEDVPHLVVGWTPVDAAGGGERTVTAHAYRRGGLHLPVGPGAVRVRAASVPRVPGAVVVVPGTAEVLLPADAAVSYHLVRAPRRLLGRGRTLLRVTLTAPGGLPEVPEFVCVARGGTLRPRNATDGTTVLRIPGPELARHGSLERELPAAPCPAPYTLRCFLLGEHAASVRLEEPSLASLVVR